MALFEYFTLHSMLIIVLDHKVPKTDAVESFVVVGVSCVYIEWEPAEAEAFDISSKTLDTDYTHIFWTTEPHCLLQLQPDTEYLMMSFEWYLCLIH